CDPGSWNDDVDNQWVPPGEESTIELSYQWQISESENGEWFDIAGAVNATYLLAAETGENYLRCQVTAEDNGIGFTGDSISVAISNIEFVTLPNSNQENIISPVTELLAASPNPFNPETKLQFILAGDSDVELAIYNLKGQKITTLLNQYITAGQYSTIWTGHDHYGKECPSGLYFAVLRAGNSIFNQKLLLIK
ncbi:MAG: T9SS type A sorting domain-containing protein, partial [Candidatus Cloacimonetes bacterium]|nr:T9SS type A sorting domain-containing protein [Candidatus Cloacimonadota bacterium]